jgi:hypothetical protein
MGRPRMPEWFTSEDSKFFKEVVTPEVWANIRTTYNHEALREECEAAGIPVDSVKFYWYKTQGISLFSKMENEGLKKRSDF